MSSRSKSGRASTGKVAGKKGKVLPDTSSFGQLPSDIKLHIFTFLPFPKELCNAALVSSSWNALSATPALWHTLDLARYPFLSDRTFRDIMQNKCGGSLKVLVLEHNQSVSSLSIKKFCHKFEGLKKLNLKNCNHLHEDALQKAIESCNALEELDISCCAITEATINTVSTCRSRTSIRTLGLQSILVGETHMAQLLSALPALSRINLSYCNLADDSLYHIASRALAAASGAAAPLVSLNLRYNARITEAGVRLLASLSTLEELRLGGIKCVDDGTLTMLAAGLPRLKVLDVTSLKMLTAPTMLAALSTRWTDMTELRLVNTDLPNDPTIGRLPFIVVKDPKPIPPRSTARAMERRRAAIAAAAEAAAAEEYEARGDERGRSKPTPMRL